jgi:hypothetical protein
MISDLVYWRGSRVSETIEKNAGVPAYAKTIEDTAAIASEKLGLATIL